MTEKTISTIEIRKAGYDEYYFVFRLPNGGIFLSIFFEDIVEAVATAENFQRNSTKNSNYLRKTNPPDQYYFIFKTQKSHPIGQSSIYKNRPAMDTGIQYIKKHLLETAVVDMTT